MHALSSVRPLEVGDELVLQPRVGQATGVRVWCKAVTNRNWSRVAACKVADSHDGRTLFVKQFIDSQLVPHPDQYRNELLSIAKAVDLFANDIFVLEPLYICEDRLLIAFEQCPMLTLDEILRSDKPAVDYAEAFELVRCAVDRILTRLQQVEESYSEDAVDAQSKAFIFHGFDVRNIGVPIVATSQPLPDKAYLFDLGVYRKGSRQEAAARFLTTFALLNWGFPFKRFVRGPLVQEFERFIDHLRPHLSEAATLRRIRREYRTRLLDVQGPTWLLRQVKRAGLLSIGLYYIWTVQRVVKRAGLAA